MTKGRVAWVFWLLVVLAVLTSTASYAWLSMSFSAGAKGIAVSLRSDTEYLQISANYSDGYKDEVSFSKDNYVFDDIHVDGIFLVTYGYLPEEGGLKIDATPITEETSAELGFPGGVYTGEGKIYRAENSGMPGETFSYEDITQTLFEGDNVIGFYLVSDSGDFDTASEDENTPYYYRHLREGTVDYVCVGTLPVGDALAGRRYWGYAVSDDESDSQGERMISVVSLDVPPSGYAYKKTVYLRAAKGTVNLQGLCISEIKVKGIRNYLTDAMRIMIVAKSDVNGEVVTFYDHRFPEDFNGELFGVLLGDRAETITVEMYIFFDGTHENAYSENGVLSNHSVDISFSIEKRYN